MDISFILNKMDLFHEEIALFFDNKTYTYAEIRAEYEKCKLALKPYTTTQSPIVALHADYSPQSIACFLVLIEMNAIIVPLSPTIKNLDKYTKIAQCEILINMLDYTFNISQNLSFSEGAVHEMLLDLKAKQSGGLILFSSGTTGEPKAAVHIMESLIAKFYTAGKRLSAISFLLFDHIGGFNTMMHSLANAGMLAIVNSRDPETICAIIEKYKIELLPTSPTFLNLILLSKAYQNYNLSSLKIISYGTEPMPKSTLRAFHDLFPDVQLKQTYGLSELGIIPTKSESSDSLWLKLREEDGLHIKIEDDILFIKTKSAMLGYLNADSPFDAEGWFNTKDKVCIKDDYILILGRTTDIVIIGGEKVYPSEVESVFLEHESVLDIFIYGVQNPIMGQVLEAKVRVQEENNNREFSKTLRKYAKEYLENYKIPSKFILTTENLHSDRFKKDRSSLS